MVIEASVDDVNEFCVRLTYENLKGLVDIEDLAWVVSPRLDDYVTAENLLKVKITIVSGKRFFASRLPLESPPLSKMVGYWFWYENLWPWDVQQFPHPEILIDPNWYSDKRDKIIEYLNSGWTHTHWRGLSFCRFQCGTPSREMGSRCLTDGEWVWPEGLVHYVEKHKIQLPEDFIDTMRKYNWNAKNRYEEPHQVPKGKHDPSYWIDWSSRFKEKQ